MTEPPLQHDRNRQGGRHEPEETITTDDRICIDPDALGLLRCTPASTYSQSGSGNADSHNDSNDTDTHNESGNTDADTAPTARVS